MKKRKFLACLLSTAMVVGMVPQTAMAEVTEEQQADIDATDLSTAEKADLNSTDATVEELAESATESGDSDVEESATHDADEIVTVVVDVTEPSLMETFTEQNGSDFSTFTEENGDQKQAIDAQVDSVVEEITGDCAQLEEASEPEVLFTYDTVFSGFSVEVPYQEYENILNMDGVKTAFIAQTYDAPVLQENTDSQIETNMVSSRNMIGTDMVQNGDETSSLNYTGKGMVVAILDTGLSYNHEAFLEAPEDPEYTSADVQAILDEKDLASEADYTTTKGGALTSTDAVSDSDVYKSAKVPFAYDYNDHETEVTPTNEEDHGTHVAGTVAGDSATIQGVAPDAQLMSMKVFNDKGSTSDAVLLAALEDAVLLEADVINMSLGSSAGFTTEANEEMQSVYDSIASAGINLDVSAGNEYTSSYSSNYGNLALTQNVDNGIVGSPSTLSAALSVASIENTYLNYSNYLETSDGNQIGYIDNGTGTGAFTSLAAGTYSFIDCGTGTTDEIAALGTAVQGKVALIKRGGITFSEKAKNATDAGAVAVLIYNNTTGTISMSIDSYTIPAVSITQADGQKLLATATDGIGTFEYDPSKTVNMASSTASQMSDFSSWGTTPELTIKPEITAPGGNIYSSIYLNEDGSSAYGLMSGTSMAAPHLSGASALVKQYVQQTYPTMGSVDQENLVNSLLMSTAVPAEDVTNYDGEEDPQIYYSVREQGAGLVNVYNAITTSAYLSVEGSERPKAELGYNTDGTYTFNMTVNNMSADELSYNLEGAVQVEAFAADESGNTYSLQADESILNNGATVTYTGSTVADDVVSVPANGTADVTVTITIDKNNETIKQYMEAYTNGFYVEGFIFAKNTDNAGIDLSVPFLGFLGDWGTASMFDADAYGDDTPVFDGCLLYNPTTGKFLGSNMFSLLTTGTTTYSKDNVAISSKSESGLTSEMSTWTTLLRGASTLTYDLTNASGISVLSKNYTNVPKSYYYINGATNTCAENEVADPFDFVGLDSTGKTLKDGTYTLTIQAAPSGVANAADYTNTITYTFSLDNTAPKFDQSKTYVFQQDGEVYLSVAATDADYLAGVEVDAYKANGSTVSIATKAFAHEKSGDVSSRSYLCALGSTSDFEAAGLSAEKVSVSFYDYAMNKTSQDISLAVEENLDVAKAEISKVENKATGSMTLSWKAVTNATGYEIYRKDSKKNSYAKLTTVAGTTTSYTDKSSIATGVTYTYKIRAYISKTSAGKEKVYYGEYSSEVGAMAATPAAVTLSSVSNSKAGVMSISFKAVSGANGYSIYRATSKNGTYSKIADVTKTSYTDSKSITLGKAYYYKVRAYVKNGSKAVYGSYSAMKSAKSCITKATVLKTVKKSTSKKLKLTWTKVTGATGYEIYRSTSKSGTYKKVKTITSGKTVTYTDTVGAKKTYYYKIKVINKSGSTTYRSVFSNAKKGSTK